MFCIRVYPRESAANLFPAPLPYGRASDTIRARQFSHQFEGAL